MKKIFICKEGTSNKFWWYESNDTTFTVACQYGRLGEEGKPHIEPNSSKWQMDDFIEKKTREKVQKKHYKEVSQEEYNAEVAVALTIGTGSKLDELKFVEVVDTEIREISQARMHDPSAKPVVYARLVDKKVAHAASNAVHHYIFGVEDAFEVQVSGRRIVSQTPTSGPMADAIADVIGKRLI